MSCHALWCMNSPETVGTVCMMLIIAVLRHWSSSCGLLSLSRALPEAARLNIGSESKLSALAYGGPTELGAWCVSGITYLM